MNTIQQKALLLNWAANHSINETKHAASNLSSVQKSFFEDALNFQSSKTTLDNKEFTTLLDTLNYKPTILKRISNFIKYTFNIKGFAQNIQPVITSRKYFQNNAASILDTHTQDLSEQLTALNTPPEGVKISDFGLTLEAKKTEQSLELTKDLLGQALIATESESYQKKVDRLEAELQNPNLSDRDRGRKKIALNGAREKLLKNPTEGLRRGTLKMLKDTQIDLKVNKVLIELLDSKEDWRLNWKQIDKLLSKGDALVNLKMNELIKKVAITKASKKNIDDIPADKLKYRVSSEHLGLLKAENAALTTKQTAYTLFLKTLPTASPAA